MCSLLTREYNEAFRILNDEGLNSDMIFYEYHYKKYETQETKLLIKLHFSVDLFEVRPENSALFFSPQTNSKVMIINNRIKPTI